MIKEFDALTRNFQHFKTSTHSTLKSDAYFEQKEPKYKLNSVYFPNDDFISDE